MKQFRLIAHQKDFSDEDLVINPKDFPDLKLKDVVEIYHPEEKFSRLLLQVNSLKEDLLSRDTVSVEQGIASSFQLRTYGDVYVNIVNFETVALDSLELTFKDQYVERGDMWRLKRDLTDSCVYLNKKVEFCGIRCQVYEMWAQGERVACGVVNEDTKIVFRSSTNLVYLFIQMSSEMWDVDINGDLYFEKAINGFFSDLFAKWKENASSHEVTIVLFSRTFYDSQTLDEFPPYMRHCIQSDYRGRFFEDFYSVAVQNERYDDWAVILVYLKKLFNNYQKLVLQIHQRSGVSGTPKGVNSTAAQGNFLEVLNMSLNVFEKHYLDRSFDRTGHLSVVITPGVGVFEVDRELTNLTKQRIIDNGVGSDLVCLGEQPLHAVPLFKFHNKNTLSTVDDYSMPHWINLSFYSSSKRTAHSSFIPRIKLPPRKVKLQKEKCKSNDLIQPRSKAVHRDDFPSLVDYDEYDAQVFRHTVPGNGTINSRRTFSLQRGNTHRKKSDNSSIQGTQGPNLMSSRPLAAPQRHGHDYDGGCQILEASRSLTTSRSSAITIPQKSPYYCEYSTIASSSDNTSPTSLFGSYEEEQSPPPRPIVGSAGSPFSCYHQKSGSTTSSTSSVRPGRALINPFDPSHVTIKLTSNRRRWTHVFPLGPTGIFMQQHHYQAIPHRASNSDDMSNNEEPTREVLHAGQLAVEARRQKKVSVSAQHQYDVSSRFKGTPSRGSIINTELKSEKSLTLLWGATGEQEWTPALTTGVDWKSLTIPACLPLTTDYFPDRRSLQNDYVVLDYDLIPELMSSDLAQKKTINHQQLSTEEVFRELVCQRLQQGFQLIVNPRATKYVVSRSALPKQSIISSPQFPSQPAMLSGRPTSESSDNKEEYFLSIGRIFHKLTLAGPTIKATCLKPRHPYPTLKISYKYRFKAPYSDSYEVSSVYFFGEKLENFNWNYLDHYICCHSEGDFGLTEFLKYMRVRLFLLPVLSQGTKKIVDIVPGNATHHCDVYDVLGSEDETQLVDNFIKFVEVLNKLRIPGCTRKQRERPINLPRLGSNTARRANPNVVSSQHPATLSFSFRERLDSNRPIERPRARTSSKAMERVRSESGNGCVTFGRNTQQGLVGDIVDVKPISSSSLSLDTGTDNFGKSHKDSSEDSSPSTTPRRLTLGSSSMEEIVEAMKQSQDGLIFLANMANLPALTFISAEAVFWVMDHIEGITSVQKATALLEGMREKDFICHSSGNPSHPFIHGFYLYHICPTDKELMTDMYSYLSLGNIDRFRKEWFEVAIDLKDKTLDPRSGFYSEKELNVPPQVFSTSISSDGDDPSKKTTKVPLFKYANLDISSSTKSNREEWGHIRYHGNYTPDAAFELVLKWMVATGTIVTELVHQNWARRATSFGFLLVPVPSDLFAVPFSPQSDPLRGSIFIPLNMDCLSDNDQGPFKGLSKETSDYHIFLLQEMIGRRFGFLPCQYDSMPSESFDFSNINKTLHNQGQGNSSDFQHYPQYVHTTGNMFLAIMTNQSIHQEEIYNMNLSSTSLKRSWQENVPLASSEEVRATQLKPSNIPELLIDSQEPKIGFYWSWNYMLSKRWKFGSTGDDQFMFTVLKDFRAFCSNSDNRLRNLWENLSYMY